MNVPPRKNDADSAARKVRLYRQRMRARGMRCVQLWVPDTRSSEFVRMAREQSRAVAASPQAAEDQAFIDAISELSTGEDE